MQPAWQAAKNLGLIPFSGDQKGIPKLTLRKHWTKLKYGPTIIKRLKRGPAWHQDLQSLVGKRALKTTMPILIRDGLIKRKLHKRKRTNGAYSNAPYVKYTLLKRGLRYKPIRSSASPKDRKILEDRKYKVKKRIYLQALRNLGLIGRTT
jgi:hypothetical protein